MCRPLLISVKKWLIVKQLLWSQKTLINSGSPAAELRSNSGGNVSWNNVFLIQMNILLPQAGDSEATAQLCSEQCLETREKEEENEGGKRARDIQVRTKSLKLHV